MSMDVQTSMRLPSALLDRADALIEALTDDPSLSLMGKMTRSKVLRLAIARGLDELERQHKRGGTTPTLRPRDSLPRARAQADLSSPDTMSQSRTSHTASHTGQHSVAMEED